MTEKWKIILRTGDISILKILLRGVDIKTSIKFLIYINKGLYPDINRYNILSDILYQRVISHHYQIFDGVVKESENYITDIIMDYILDQLPFESAVMMYPNIYVLLHHKTFNFEEVMRYAVIHNQDKIILQLIEYGFPTEYLNEYLNLAINMCNTSIISLLLEYTKNVSKHSFEIAFDNFEILKLLIENGVSIPKYWIEDFQVITYLYYKEKKLPLNIMNIVKSAFDDELYDILIFVMNTCGLSLNEILRYFDNNDMSSKYDDVIIDLIDQKLELNVIDIIAMIHYNQINAACYALDCIEFNQDEYIYILEHIYPNRITDIKNRIIQLIDDIDIREKWLN